MKKLLSILMLVAFISMSTIATTYALPAPFQTTQHLKKDGTPDRRFKENKTAKTTGAKVEAKKAEVKEAKSANTAGPLKKDGTPDMRHKANQTAAPAKTAATGPLKKDGTPDMRHKANQTAKKVTPPKK
jgi:hypothetical protein